MRILCHPADFARMTNWKNDQAPCTTTMAGSLLGAQSKHHDAEVHPPFSLACAREHQPRPMLAAYRVVLHLPRHGRSWSPTTQDVSFRYGMFLLYIGILLVLRIFTWTSVKMCSKASLSPSPAAGGRAVLRQITTLPSLQCFMTCATQVTNGARR